METYLIRQRPFRLRQIGLWGSMCAMLCLVGASHAQQTYYVATNGSDIASGLSTNTPFLTLQKALDTVGPGDTILMRGGTYRGRAQATQNGTAAQPITLQAYSNEVPVLKGSIMVTNWTLHSGAIWKRTGWTNWSQQVFVDEEPLQMIGKTAINAYAPIGLGVADMMPGSFFVSTNTQTLYIWLPDNEAPHSHLIEASVGDYFRILELLSFYHTRGLHVRHANVIVQFAAVFTGNNSIMENCTIQDNDMIGVSVGENAVLQDCDISHNGVLGVHGIYTNMTIRNNLVYSNNYRGFNDNFISAGIKLHSAGASLVESNLVHDNFGNGIWLDFCRDESLKRVRANILLRNRRPPSRPDAAAAALFAEISRNVLFENNLLIDNSITGIRIAESDGCRILNNTIAGTEGHAGIEARLTSRYIPINQYVDDLPENYQWTSFTSNQIANNILYDNQVDYDLYWPTNSPSTNVVVQGNTSDFNLFYRETNAPVFRAGSIWTNLATFVAATGFDLHSLQQTPRLSAPAALDYRPAFNSPAVDAGTNLPEVISTTDLEGEARVQFGSVDLGCYEFNGSAEAIAPAISISTPGGILAYDTPLIEGINNANVVGEIIANVSEDGGTTNLYPVDRTTDTAWEINSLVLETGIQYAITVIATNLNGTPASDSVVVERGGIGTGQPWIWVTNRPPLDALTTTYPLGGSNNSHVAGSMQWINYYAGAPISSGEFSRAGATWTTVISGLQTGENRVVFHATNAWGILATTTATVHHGETPLHYVSTNSITPAYPYLSWETAAHVLMDAVDAASDGDRILVGPGDYAHGYRDHLYGAARVLLDKGVTLESSDGAATTTIHGYREGEPIAMRCILMLHSNAVLKGFTLTGGTALGIYPLERKYGGGLLAFDMQEISDCLFINNTALPDGSGGGAMVYESGGLITRSTFASNTAANGAGLALWFGKNTQGSQLIAFGNQAEVSGGGFSIDNCARVHSMLAYGNHAGHYGGGFSIANNVFIWNTTSEDNSAGLGGGGYYFIASTAEVYNAMAWSNTPNALGVASNHLPHRVYNSLLGGDLPTSVVTYVRLNREPEYQNAAGGDYRLQKTSPGIDAGIQNTWITNRLDLDGFARKAGPALDLGAYEYWARVWATLSATAYYSGTSSWVNLSITWAPDRVLSNYTVSLSLPPGWSVGACTGGPPATIVSPTQLVFQTALTSAPTVVQLRLDVPPSSSGLQTVVLHQAYQVTGMTSPVSESAAASLTFDQYKYLDVTPIGSGYVTINNGWYDPGDAIRLYAEAAAGWRFRGWLGDTENAITNQDLSLNIIMDQHRTIQADFVKLVTLTVTSAFSAVSPPELTYVIDQGTRMDLSALATVTNQGVTYVVAGWQGTGTLPSFGTARSLSAPIDQDTSLTWIWNPVSITHQASGYRIRGTLTADITLTMRFEPMPEISQVWFHPVLPPGASLLDAWGAQNPSVTSNGFVLVQQDLTTGEAEVQISIKLPPDHHGPFPFSSEGGVNALPGETFTM